MVSALMEGHSYNRAVRVHKLYYEAFRRVLSPNRCKFLSKIPAMHYYPRKADTDHFVVVFGPASLSFCSTEKSRKSTNKQTDVRVKPKGKWIERISLSERALS